MKVTLKECSYVGVSLYRLHVPSAFCGRTEFDMDANHVFPQCVLTAISLVGGGPAGGGARAGGGCGAGLPLC